MTPSWLRQGGVQGWWEIKLFAFTGRWPDLDTRTNAAQAPAPAGLYANDQQSLHGDFADE